MSLETLEAVLAEIWNEGYRSSFTSGDGMAGDSKADAAKAELARLQQTTGARTLSDYEVDAAAVAEKTARLRALRLAREAALPPKLSAAPKRNKAKAAAQKKQAKASLAEWLAVQKQDGR
jgi:hypothetical protein